MIVTEQSTIPLFVTEDKRTFEKVSMSSKVGPAPLAAYQLYCTLVECDMLVLAQVNTRWCMFSVCGVSPPHPQRNGPSRYAVSTDLWKRTLVTHHAFRARQFQLRPGKPARSRGVSYHLFWQFQSISFSFVPFRRMFRAIPLSKSRESRILCVMWELLACGILDREGLCVVSCVAQCPKSVPPAGVLV